MSIQRFDYSGVVGDVDYAEGTYVRYEDYLSALESITKDIVDKAYDRGYKDAEKYYTNSCFLCGYAGEWSTWECDDCLKGNPDLEENDD